MKKIRLSRQLKVDLTGYAFILPNIIGVSFSPYFP